MTNLPTNALSPIKNCEEFTDQPLSPVLRVTKTRFKPLHKRNILKKKCNTSIEKNSKLEENFTTNREQHLDILDQISELEKIERQREDVFQKLSTSSLNNKIFHEPIYPIPVVKELENREYNDELSQITPVPELKYTPCSGLDVTFHTAKGEEIIVDEELLRDCSKLFDDEFNLEQRKYNFLKKSDCFMNSISSNEETIKPDSILKFETESNNKTSIEISYENTTVIPKDSKNLQNKVFKGFTKAQIRERKNNFFEFQSHLFKMKNHLEHSKLKGFHDQSTRNHCKRLKDFYKYTKRRKMEIDEKIDLHCGEKLDLIHPTQSDEVAIHPTPKDTDLGVNLVENLLDKEAHEFFSMDDLKFELCDVQPEPLFNEITTAIKVEKINVEQTLNIKDEPINNQSNNNKHTNAGFQTALGNAINVSENALKTISSLFDDDFRDNKQPGDISLKKTSGKPINISNTALDKARNLFQGIESNVGLNFESSGKIAKTTHNNIQNSAAISNNANETVTNLVAFKSAHGNAIKLTENQINMSEKLFQDLDDDNQLRNSGQINLVDFRSSSGNAMKLSEINLNKAKQLFANIDCEETVPDVKENVPYHDADARDLLLDYANEIKSNYSTENAMRNPSNVAKTLFANLGSDLSGREINTSNKSPENKMQTVKDNSMSGQKRKRLGIASSRIKPISEDKLSKAKLLFEDIMSPTKQQNNSQLKITPLKNNHLNMKSSTPLREMSIEHNQGRFPFYPDLTPIKMGETKVSNWIMDEPTKGNMGDWINEMNNERIELEKQLRIVNDRLSALIDQKVRMHSETNFSRNYGSLLIKKQQNERIPLGKLHINSDTDRQSIKIDPQNAKYLHFTCTNQSAVETMDGAIVIPNRKGTVGLTEIVTAFGTMPGIDRRLIPDGWIENHHKWVVWKLASYRNRLLALSDCFTVDNIMQQLRYRYDTEIVNEKWPTLRKIFELDDNVQKTMVLCVSNLIPVESQTNRVKFDLELTDGWYSIQTTIDEPLNNQIRSAKIQIGTKLIVCGAELGNCHGCHPLESAAKAVRLKITYNSTRRARWYTKLGYHKISIPFPVRLDSVHPNGGLINCIRVFVARVYPLKYLEKVQNSSVWRNQKAEERRAVSWKMQYSKQMEDMEEKVRRDFELEIENNKTVISCNYSNIQSVSCPETLYKLYKSNGDPDLFCENLSMDQRSMIMEYQNSLYQEVQQNISVKIKEKMNELKSTERNIVPVLTILVVDSLNDSGKTCYFNIWKPNDNHLQILKENCFYSIYNVIPKMNGVLAAMNKTQFHQEFIQNSTDFDKYKRKFVAIKNLETFCKNHGLKEFDTVGIIVQLTVTEKDQNLWLSDLNQNFLSIWVYENSDHCLLFEKLNKGEIISISNLSANEKVMYSHEARANLFTVVSKHPQGEELKNQMNSMLQQTPQDLGKFLAECEKKIELSQNANLYSESFITSHFTSNLNASDDDSTLQFSKNTTS